MTSGVTTWLNSTGFTQLVLPATHPHVYPWMKWAILHSLRKNSPDGAARARQCTFGSAYYSSIDLKRVKGWVGLVGWPYSEWFTHVSGHPSATGGAWDRESSPVEDRRSTTVPRNTLWSQLARSVLGVVFPANHLAVIITNQAYKN